MLFNISMKIKFLIVLSVALFAIQCLNFLFDYSFSTLGIHPRSLGRVWTVFTAPFIHGSFIHMANNIVGLCIFSMMYFSVSFERYIKSVLLIMIVGGMLVWIAGRDAYHIGASGVVFGLWGLCVSSAVFERSIKNIIIAIVVLFFYGGTIYGLVPKTGVSFEGHLFGVLAGVLCAYLNSKKSL